VHAHPILADVQVLVLNNDPHIPHVSLHDAALQADHVPPAGQTAIVVVVSRAVDTFNPQTYILLYSALEYGEQHAALGKMQTGVPQLPVT
jgi:hypothetical protein